MPVEVIYKSNSTGEEPEKALQRLAQERAELLKYLEMIDREMKRQNERLKLKERGHAY